MSTILIKDLESGSYYDTTRSNILYVYEVSVSSTFGTPSLVKVKYATFKNGSWGEIQNRTNIALTTPSTCFSKITKLPPGMPPPPSQDAVPLPKECNCGVKHTGGIHSDWCRINEKDIPFILMDGFI